MKRYLALDMGGTFIKYALMEPQGEIAASGKVPSPLDSMEHLLEVLRGIGQQFQGAYAGVAVSMPGRIDTKRGIAHTGGMFTYIRDTPVGQLFADCLGQPVCAANDAKCAASAELWSGALQGVSNGAVVVLGTGTGGGVVLDGKVWMGTTFAAGELSVLPVRFAGLAGMGKGSHDLDTDLLWAHYASATGLLHQYAIRKGVDPAGLDGLQFFAAYDAGEKEAVEALDTFGEMTAAGIYAVQSVLDLERYAIGGGISARPEVTDIIREKLGQLYDAIFFTPFGKPEVVHCKYGNDANLLGALRFFLEQEKMR